MEDRNFKKNHFEGIGSRLIIAGVRKKRKGHSQIIEWREKSQYTSVLRSQGKKNLKEAARVINQRQKGSLKGLYLWDSHRRVLSKV